MMKRKTEILALLLILIPIISCSKKAIDENAAENLVMQLPEVQTFVKLMDESGEEVTAIVMSEDEGDSPGEGYMMFTVAESHPSHVVTWQRFFVKREGGEIVVADVIDDGFLTLEGWRKKYAGDIKANEDALAKAKLKRQGAL